MLSGFADAGLLWILYRGYGEPNPRPDKWRRSAAD